MGRGGSIMAEKQKEDLSVFIISGMDAAGMLTRPGRIKPVF